MTRHGGHGQDASGLGGVGFASLRCGRFGFGVVGQSVVWFGPKGRSGLVSRAEVGIGVAWSGSLRSRLG